MCNCYVIEKGICGGGRDVCCVLRYLVSDRILIFSVFGNSYPTPPPPTDRQKIWTLGLLGKSFMFMSLVIFFFQRVAGLPRLGLNS